MPSMIICSTEEAPSWKGYTDLYYQERVNKCGSYKINANAECENIADKAYDKWQNCRTECSNVDFIENKCGSPYSNKKWNECADEADKECTLKCKDFLLFEFNSSDEKNNTNNKKESVAVQNKLIGLSVDSKISIVPCIGETPKNSELCFSDDKEVFYYTEKELVEYCSVPESEPKCEYVCKDGYDLVDGECKSTGFFVKILNWFINLF